MLPTEAPIRLQALLVQSRAVLHKYHSLMVKSRQHMHPVCPYVAVNMRSL